MNLHKSSMLVKLTINQWDGFKKDKRVSERVDEEFETAGNAGNYNKRLIDKMILRPISRVANKIRAEHNRMTHPWCYDGVGLLPNSLYFQYTEIQRNLKNLHETQVRNFIDQYPVHRANAASKLGKLFNEEDYPSPDELAGRFSIGHQFFPVPQSEGFIIEQLGELENKHLRDQLEKELATTQQEALRTLYSRVEQLVGHMHERLSDPKLVFRDSLVENVEQLVKVLPGLNVFNDPVLEQVHRDLQDKVLVATPEDLRNDMPTRNEVADRAYDILALLKGRADERKAA